MNPMQEPGKFCTLHYRVMRAGLPQHAEHILMYLADKQGQNDSCWPSHKTIATNCGCSPRSAKRWTKYLRDIGAITKVGTKFSYKQHVNVYRVNPIDSWLVDNVTQEHIIDSWLVDNVTQEHIIDSWLVDNVTQEHINEQCQDRHPSEVVSELAKGSVRAREQCQDRHPSEVVSELAKGSVRARMEVVSELANKQCQNCHPKQTIVNQPSFNQTTSNKRTPRARDEVSKEGAVQLSPAQRKLIDSLRSAYPRWNATDITLHRLITAWVGKGHRLTARQITRCKAAQPSISLPAFFKARRTAAEQVMPGWKMIIEQQRKSEADDSYERPAELAVEAWTKHGLNSIADEARVIQAIKRPARQLCDRLGKDEYKLTLDKAFEHRAHWNLESPTCQTIEWLFKSNSQGGTDVYNLERAARGEFNNWNAGGDRQAEEMSDWQRELLADMRKNQNQKGKSE